MDKIIDGAYIHVRRSGDTIEISGISLQKSKEAQWFLFKDEDKVKENHKSVADKWKSLKKPPVEYRNFYVQGDDLLPYLSLDKKSFSFGGQPLQRDEQNSIYQSDVDDLDDELETPFKRSKRNMSSTPSKSQCLQSHPRSSYLNLST